jgi:hypothetical protein
MILVQSEWFSVNQCLENPANLYVFGDNTFRTGKGGQAQIRDCQNTFGIATKWAPNNTEGAFFADTINCLEIVEKDIAKLLKLYQNSDYENLVFPVDGLGSGLSDMPNRCPLLYRRMNHLIQKHFGVIFKIK